MKKHFFYLLVLAVFFYSCSGNKKNENTRIQRLTGTLSYAQLFRIDHQADYTILTLLNPWKENDILDIYYLVNNTSVKTPDDGQKIKIPLESVMINSATHLGFMDLIGELDKITGICNPEYIYNPTILKMVHEGKIKDMGDSFNLDIENLFLLNPQAIITTAYNADDENSRKLRQSGLNLLYNIEWQEKTLLGRAEWIKYFGVLFNKEAQADSIFSAIEEQYNNIKTLANKVDHKPTILSGQDYRGSWFMPGGKSFNAQLYADAGGDYFYKDDNSSGSISTTIEEALIHFHKADVWLGTQANTLEELGKVDSKYKLFNAYKEGNVYNMNKRVNHTGGNDYWESAVARPDLLLSDIIKILHPSLLPQYELTYYQKLK